MSKKTRRIDHWQDPQAPAPTSRKPSASVLVRNEDGHVLLLRRPDNDLWTIPTGALKKGETATECGIRECREETGVEMSARQHLSSRPPCRRHPHHDSRSLRSALGRPLGPAHVRHPPRPTTPHGTRPHRDDTARGLTAGFKPAPISAADSAPGPQQASRSSLATGPVTAAGGCTGRHDIPSRIYADRK